MTAPSSSPKLSLTDVSKTFHTRAGETVALSECSLEVADGEFVTIVGPSGCGKSTLLMIAAGLETPSTGDVTIDGKPAGSPGPDRSVVFQKFALFPSETVAQNIRFGLDVAGIAKEEKERRLQAQLELMNLTQFRNSYPHELSGGMQQRVAIARALVVQPDILLMDEPFGALDAQTRALLQEEVGRLRRELGFTVLFITHSVEEAIYLADRVIVMTARPGRVKAEIEVPHAAQWRSEDIETAMGYTDFNSMRQDIWSLVRDEISLH